MEKVQEPKMSVFIATSLDGYIARPDGSIDWLSNDDGLSEGEDFGFGEFFSSVDVLVMGRNSFEKVLEFDHWPYQNKPVVVVSRSGVEVPEDLRGAVEVVSLEPAELVGRFAREGRQRIYLDGGKLIQSFLRAGLVDDITVTKIPVLIGQGRSLFGELDTDIKLQHVSTQTWDNGFVMSSYEVVKK